MSLHPSDKKHQIFAELGEETDKEELVRTMEQLDKYVVVPPSLQDTSKLIALLKPVLQEQPLMAKKSARMPWSTEHFKQPIALQLVRSQAMLLSKWFVLISTLVLFAGLTLTNVVNGNTLRFLANASPILGILTVYYEFRAKLRGVAELEAACPYSPAQLAAARLIVVLGYDLLLCLAVTPVVSYWQGHILWQVIVSWLAPLLLMLGIALSASFSFGIVGGCLAALAAWGIRIAASEGRFVFSLLLPKQSAIFSDLISLTVGTLLILYSYRRLTSDAMPLGDDQSD